jgi:hypothetical protein
VKASKRGDTDEGSGDSSECSAEDPGEWKAAAAGAPAESIEAAVVGVLAAAAAARGGVDIQLEDITTRTETFEKVR